MQGQCLTLPFMACSREVNPASRVKTFRLPKLNSSQHSSLIPLLPSVERLHCSAALKCGTVSIICERWYAHYVPYLLENIFTVASQSNTLPPTPLIMVRPPLIGVLFTISLQSLYSSSFSTLRRHLFSEHHGISDFLLFRLFVHPSSFHQPARLSPLSDSRKCPQIRLPPYGNKQKWTGSR